MEVATRRREQEVWQACDDLWAIFGSMKHVTGDGIRERLVALGKSRGSPNEIYKYRKTWLSSRGLSFAENDFTSSSSDSDPITRAVRIVHEQLRDSTESKISALNEEFTQKLAEKEQELSQSKQALENVLVEFANIEQKLSHRNEELKNTSSQLNAEIDVRRALEKELQIQKSLHLKDLACAEDRVSELKGIFAQELGELTRRAAEQNLSYERQTKDLVAKIETLGHEYSDSLMAVKLALLNQEILTKQQEEKLVRAQEKMQALHVELKTLRNDLAHASGEEIRLRATLAERINDIGTATLQAKLLREQNKLVERRLKKAEITIARLRASFTQGGRRGCS